MERQNVERFLEFLLIGVGMGVLEDMIAIQFATDAVFTVEMILIVVVVAVPFAAFSELIVDNGEFLTLRRIAAKISSYL